MIDPQVLLPFIDGDVSFIVGGEEMRLELMEDDAIRNGFTAEETDLFIPACSTCYKPYSSVYAIKYDRE